MKVEDVRLRNARRLVSEAGSLKAFALTIDRAPTQISRAIGKNPTQTIGNRMARHIENCFGLREGWMDTPFIGVKATFSERLNQALETNGIAERQRATYIQERLSQKISTVAIRKWLNGASTPNLDKIHELSAILTTPVSFLVGSEDPVQGKQMEVSPRPINGVPVVSWGQIERRDVTSSSYVANPFSSCNGNIVAVKVINSVMAGSNYGNFDIGGYVYLELKPKSEAGKAVAAITEQGIIFRELGYLESGQPYLAARNKAHPVIYPKKLEIVAEAVGYIRLEDYSGM